MKDINRSERELELKLRAYETLKKSEIIKLEALAQYENINKFMNDYPDSKLESMAWEERERVMGEIELYSEKVTACELALKDLDAEYEVLREEVNAFYGREVMKPIPLDFLKNDGNEIGEVDPADWWKS